MTNEIKKATFRDLDLQAAEMNLGWLMDRDETYLYFSKDTGEEPGNKEQTTRYNYSWVDGVLSVDVSSGQVVRRLTQYTPEYTTNGEGAVGLTKKFNDNDLTVVEALYIAGSGVDGHGDAYKDPVEGPRRLVKAIGEGRAANTLQYSLFHSHRTKGFSIEKEWVSEKETVLDSGDVIPPNTPMGLIKFHNKSLYDLRVAGKIAGLSMGAKGVVEAVGKDVYNKLISDVSKARKPLRIISDFIFTHKAAHYAYTSWDQGGAASLINEPIAIMKSKSKLTDHQAEILELVGEEYTELDKSNSAVATAPSTPTNGALDAGVDNETVEKGHTMSVEQSPEYLALATKLLAMELKEELLPLNLEKSVSNKVSVALAAIPSDLRTDVIKTLLDMKASHDTEVQALVSQKETLEKSISTLEKSASTSQNPVAELLKGEKGEGAPEQAAPVKLTLAQEAALKFNARIEKV